MKKIRIFFSNNTFLKLLLILSFFVFSAAFIPVIGSIFLVLLPMVLFVQSTINSKIQTITAFLTAFLLLFIISSSLHLNTPLLAIFVTGFAGLFIAQIAAQNFSIEKTIIYPSLFIIVAIFFYFIYSGFELSVNPWKLVEKYIAAIIDANIKIFSRLSLEKENINFFIDNKQNITNFFTQIFPSLIIIAVTFIVWINFLMGKEILTKTGISWPNLSALARWKSPDLIIWIFIIFGGLFFMPHQAISFFSLNIFLLTCFIYLLQGLAIVSFLFQNKNVPNFFRYLFYFLIAVQQILVIPIIIIGLFDIWIDFRKHFQKDQTTI